MLCGENPEPYLSALRDSYPDASAGLFHEIIWTDMFRRTSLKAAELSSLAGPGGWLYRFNLCPSLPEYKNLGATHGSEWAFTFNVFENEDTHAFTYHDRDDPIVKRVAKTWSNTIVQFMRTGRPGITGSIDWPIYEPKKRASLIIDEEFRSESDSDALHRALWKT